MFSSRCSDFMSHMHSSNEQQSVKPLASPQTAILSIRSLRENVYKRHAVKEYSPSSARPKTGIRRLHGEALLINLSL
jgi:hypothetical protein